MLSGKRISVVIPVFNECERILPILKKIPDFVDNIIVVDDGSTDDTQARIRSINFSKLRVLRHIVNRGVGAATNTGLKYALRTQADIIVTLDGDGQHNPADIGRIIEPALDGTADVVVGSRFLGDLVDMPYVKRLGNLILNTVTTLLYGFHCSDTQSGFRAFSKEAASKLSITVDRYGFCSEVIGEIKRHNPRLAEVPIDAVYLNKRGEANILDGVEIVLDLLYERFRR